MTIPRECTRMINVLGQREMELAAIKILDHYWEAPYAPIDIEIFTDDLEKAGFAELKAYNWLTPHGVATRAFWQRVHGR